MNKKGRVDEEKIKKFLVTISIATTTMLSSFFVKR